GSRRAFPPEGVLLSEHHKRAFVLLAIWSCAEGLITWGLNLQMIDILQGAGLTIAEAIGVWAFVGPCQSIARLIELASGGRHSILTSVMGAAVSTSLSFLILIPFGISVPTAIAFCIALGIGHGLFAIARNTLPLALFGATQYGTWVGLLAVPQNIVNALAPVVFAAMVARLGAQWALSMGAAAAWIGLVSVYFLVRYCRAAMRERDIDI
ncbi:MAG: hypothetical protein ACK5JT_20135, partial [Hyphomicrobiaceae bacterium]